MIMNLDDFDKRLQRRPSRTIPKEWRAEILSAAKTASGQVHPSRINPEDPRPAQYVSRLRSILSTILWPSPAAWAGLAAIWVIILVVNSTSASGARELAQKVSPPAPEAIAAWKEQERLLTELIGPHETRVADRPKPGAPRPRSDRQNGFSLA